MPLVQQSPIAEELEVEHDTLVAITTFFCEEIVKLLIMAYAHSHDMGDLKKKRRSFPTARIMSLYSLP